MGVTDKLVREKYHAAGGKPVEGGNRLRRHMHDAANVRRHPPVPLLPPLLSPPCFSPPFAPSPSLLCLPPLRFAFSPYSSYRHAHIPPTFQRINIALDRLHTRDFNLQRIHAAIMINTAAACAHDHWTPSHLESRREATAATAETANTAPDSIASSSSSGKHTQVASSAAACAS